MDGFDRIIIRQAGVEIPLAQGWDRFQENLTAQFPSERQALQAFVEKIKTTVDRFGPYHLQPADPKLLPTEVFSEGAWDVLNRYFKDDLLKAALGAIPFFIAEIVIRHHSTLTPSSSTVM
ncbi:MAG: hypothetical protein HWD63_14395 [Candidatus Parvibacillus calidus]|nr:MAG: hypothetical protein HWD63_14395 [Candidatus Parvibacillus calidus]